VSAIDPDLDRFMPRVIPFGWRLVDGGYDGALYVNGDGLRVIASVADYEDRKWPHVSCSRQNRLPTWDDLKLVKTLFIGREQLALQVLPSDSKYVNFHPFCLHLWCPVDGVDVVPDFTGGTGMI
jgi:hypothetical protein